MYAVIASGGKQYRVAEGQTIKVEKLPVEVGESIDFSEVLMVADEGEHHIGEPFLTGAKVSATVVDQARAKKIEILKFKRRKHHMKRMGHRQYFTAVEITGISLAAQGKSKSEDA